MSWFFSYPSIFNYITKDAFYAKKEVHMNTEKLPLQKCKLIVKTNTIKNAVIFGLEA